MLILEYDRLKQYARKLVEKEGGPTAAARVIGISQSAISQALSDKGTRFTATLIRIVTTLTGKTVREIYLLEDREIYLLED